MDYLAMVREFHEKYGFETREAPTVKVGRNDLRKKLHSEEVGELNAAIDAEDIVEIADGIADSIYVLLGKALTYGIPIDAIFAEVHRSNMTKDGGLRGDGKLLKGPGFDPPRIAEVLDLPVDAVISFRLMNEPELLRALRRGVRVED